VNDAVGILTVAVLFLSGAVTILASSVPFLYWKCFRLEARLESQRIELQRQIDTLDEALSRLLEGIGVTPTNGEGG